MKDRRDKVSPSLLGLFWALLSFGSGLKVQGGEVAASLHILEDGIPVLRSNRKKLVRGDRVTDGEGSLCTILQCFWIMFQDSGIVLEN